MKEFTSKVPYGWWEEFRQRSMTACNLTPDQWNNRCIGRTQLTEAERLVMNMQFEQLKKEFEA